MIRDKCNIFTRINQYVKEIIHPSIKCYAFGSRIRHESTGRKHDFDVLMLIEEYAIDTHIPSFKKKSEEINLDITHFQVSKDPVKEQYKMVLHYWLADRYAEIMDKFEGEFDEYSNRIKIDFMLSYQKTFGNAILIE